jgi:outer membrane protein assembly factor BamB
MNQQRFLIALLSLAAALLSACSSTSERPKAQEVVVKEVMQDVQIAWTSQIGAVNFPLQVGVSGDTVALANAQGRVSVISASTGKTMWTYDVSQSLSAGVGTDGRQVAVVTRSSDLVVMANGQLQWRVTMPAASFTPPLIAGGRVFVLTSDRRILAFDGESGRTLWTQQRNGDPLVLKAQGVLQPYKNTLIVGLLGRVAALDADNGLIRWESAIATPRGTNDVERLVDLIGPAFRQGNVICARAFQSQVGCVNADREQIVWTRSSVGDQPVTGNQDMLVAAQANGVVQAFRLDSGARVWDTERLKYHVLGSPIITPRGVLIADNGGYLYVLSLADGAVLNRIKISSDDLAAPLVKAGDVYLIVSRSGSITAVRLP